MLTRLDKEEKIITQRAFFVKGSDIILKIWIFQYLNCIFVGLYKF